MAGVKTHPLAKYSPSWSLEISYFIYLGMWGYVHLTKSITVYHRAGIRVENARVSLGQDSVLAEHSTSGLGSQHLGTSI